MQTVPTFRHFKPVVQPAFNMSKSATGFLNVNKPNILISWTACLEEQVHSETSKQSNEFTVKQPNAPNLLKGNSARCETWAALSALHCVQYNTCKLQVTGMKQSCVQGNIATS